VRAKQAARAGRPARARQARARPGAVARRAEWERSAALAVIRPTRLNWFRIVLLKREVHMKWSACVAVLAGLVVALLAQPVYALDAKLEVVAKGMNAPLGLTSAPDGSHRRFVWEQTGKVRILMPDGTIKPEPFLDLGPKIVSQHDFFDERGLLSFEFHPKFKENGKFYIYYSRPLETDDLGQKLWYSHSNVLVEMKVSASDPNKADMSSERELLKVSWPQFNHNGGAVHFGPDGLLYVSLGDGGYADDYGIGHNKAIGNGQDLDILNGKIIRIDVNSGNPYTVPKDNPFVGKKGVRPEIWAYGFRNPWRMSFDMGGAHRLFEGDVGQNSFEEVNIIKKGGNYGWRTMEGTHCFDWLNPNKHKPRCNHTGMTPPIMEYNNCNVTKNCKGLSITGGFVYRGPNKAWQGKYFFGDWSKTFGTKAGSVFVGSESKGKWKMEDVKFSNMMSFDSYVLAFGQDEDGEVYVMSTDTTGPTGGQDTIYKIVP
jgi:glucose/arabinose dehydrogenase